MRLIKAIVCVCVALAGSQALPASADDGLSVSGTSFVLRQDDRTLRSADLVGAELDLGNGQWLRIDAVRVDPKDSDILLHQLSTRGTHGAWHNLCSADRHGKQEGFPLPGRWDEQGRFQLSDQYIAMTCTDGAQAKCVRFGYKPWKLSADGRSLVPLYESCVRMTRADYCGDGTATTLDGTQIDMFDDHGVWESDHPPGFSFEAGWTPQGAVCVNHTRIPKNLSLDELARRCPRLADAVGEQCDEKEARRRGAVLFNNSR